MARLRARAHALLPLLGCLAWLSTGLARGDGRVFLLEPRNGSDGGFEEAAEACVAQGARVASAIELRHAVVECTFSACARGWLTGPSIGITVCRSVAGSLRAVDMQVENVTETSERLSVFCVKDTGTPCGYSPLFPNTQLQQQTGLELGDELLYTCNPGYTLPSGETAFSLLCDSCGEWYGLVQLCVKDDAEAFIDYEDRLPDEHEVHHVSLTPVTDTDHEEESTAETEQDEPVRVEKEKDKDEEDPVVSVTEPLVSQLSQKHMFWFPSEAFQEEEHPAIPTHTPIKGPTPDENYIGVKTDDRELDAEATTVGHDGEYIRPPPTVEPVSHSVDGTEESWLDGYPISQEEEKAGAGSTEEPGPGEGVTTESMTDSLKETEIESVTGGPEDEGVKGVIHSNEEDKTGGVSKTSTEWHFKEVTDGEEETEGVTKSPEDSTYGGRFGIKEEEFQGVTDTPHKKIADVVTEFSEESHVIVEGPTVEESEGEAKRPLDFGDDRSKETRFHGVTDRPNGVEMSPTSFISITQIAGDLDDMTVHKRPYTPSSAPENVSSSQNGKGLGHTVTPSGLAPLDTTPGIRIISNVATPTISDSWETIPMVEGDVIVETHGNRSVMEGDKGPSLDQQERAEDGDCGTDPCQVGGRGPMIAAIIIGILAAVVGVALGVWCYKRRQQKSSHYQLNGTNRQTQCIELQQTV